MKLFTDEELQMEHSNWFLEIDSTNNDSKTQRKTRGQSNLTKSASKIAHSPVRGHPRGSKFVPLNYWGKGSY